LFPEEVTAPTHCLKPTSYKAYDSTGFAIVTPGDYTQAQKEFYVKTEDIVK
jgi:hypothetical protein